MQKYYLAIDLGTTGTKSILFDDNSKEIARGYKSYPLSSPFDLAFEQNPNDWVDAVVESVNVAVKDLGDKVISLSISAQGGSFFLADIDKEGKIVPLTDSLTWMDKRAELESQELLSLVGDNDYFYYRTGSRLGAGSFPARFLWLKKHCPELVNKTKIILSTSDYIYYVLTGKKVIDYTSASMMDIFNPSTLSYDNKLLSLLSITEDILPKLTKAGEVIGDILPDVAKKLNISPSTKVVCGAHDQYSAFIGSNYFGGKDLLISSGTTWVVFGKTQRLALDENHFYSCVHPFGDYGAFCSAVSSGVVIDWERQLFSISYEDLNRELPLRPFEKDLLVYPFISGSGSYRKKNQSFSIENAVFRFNKFDIVKATMEGVAFEIKEIISSFSKAGMKPDKIIIAGGAVKSLAWMQILSNVLGMPIYISNQADRCCFGAYSLAKKGVSNQITIFDFDGTIVEPEKNLVPLYQQKFIEYNKKFK